MPLNERIVRWLGISRWPVALRHPAIKALLKRKRLRSFPFSVRLGDLLYEGDAANLIDYHVLTRGGFEPGLDQLLADWRRYRHARDQVFVDVGANAGLHRKRRRYAVASWKGETGDIVAVPREYRHFFDASMVVG